MLGLPGLSCLKTILPINVIKLNLRQIVIPFSKFVSFLMDSLISFNPANGPVVLSGKVLWDHSYIT